DFRRRLGCWCRRFGSMPGGRGVGGLFWGCPLLGGAGGRGAALGRGLRERGRGVRGGGGPGFCPGGRRFGPGGAGLLCPGQDPRFIGELSFWTGMLSAPSLLLVEGSLDPARDVMGTAGRLTLTLPAAVTEGLLRRVAGAFHAGIQHVLLTALALAIAQWCRRRDREAIAAVLIDVEGHGGEEGFADTDLSRTVGWFTSVFPVRLDLCGVDIEEALAGGAALGRALKIVKEQLRGVPHNGIGYGLLRYLNAQTGSRLAGFVAPQIGFN